MNKERHRSKLPEARRRGWLAGFAGLAISAGVSVADVTLEINVGPIVAPAGTVGILVADAEGDGFVDLTGPQGLATRLSAGETLGWSDDVIVAVIEADTGSHWNGRRGFGDLAREIDYEALGVEEGDALSLYWFPNHQQPGAQLKSGDFFRWIRSDVVGNSGGTIGFALPADGEVQAIAHLAPVLGGDSDPEKPAGSTQGGIDRVGSSLTELPTDGRRMSRTLSPGEVEYFWVDISEAGGLKVVTDGLDGLIARLFRTDGEEMKTAAPMGGRKTELVGGVSPGRYFLSIEGVTDRVSGRFALESESGEFRPDLMIRRPGSTQLAGIRRYNLSGASQTVTAKTRQGKRVSFATEGMNRGTLTDGFIYTGSRSNRYFVVRFFHTKGGRKNVTAAVRKGYDAGDVEPNRRAFIAMEVDPKGRGKSKGGAKAFKGFVQLTSDGFPQLKDRVRAILISQ